MAHAQIPMSPDTRPLGAAPRLPHALLGFVRGVLDGFDAWHRYQHLSVASDDELRELGLRREDVARHAMFGPDART